MNLLKKLFLSKINTYSIVGIVFILLSVISIHKYGVKVVVDSERYLYYVENFELLFRDNNSNFWYIGYILFLKISKGICNSNIFVISLQYFISFCSVFLLLEVILIITKSLKISACIVIFYLMNFEVVYWNSYLLCESFYISFIILLCYFLTQFYLNNKKNKTILISLLIVGIYTSLIKPTGVAILIVFVIFLIKKHIKSRLILSLSILIFVMIIFILLNKMLLSFNVVSDYIRGDVIYLISSYENIINKYPYLKVDNNSPLIIRKETVSTFIGMLYFIIDNFSFWIKLFLLKVTFFLLHVRPYWSISHNINSIIILFPLYIYSIVNFFNYKYDFDIKLIFISYFVVHLFIVGFTVADWDGRFFMPVYPVLLMYSSFYWRYSSNG
ncbi:oligosaccharide repeat unit polymerase [Flammeovirga pectinis]|uniref:Oligosaccharide repeat unit polymerase n=1 Tax=Flammeovirga pectinis TaxID=2494373 RepID=A0A3Q9FPK8_9BACT|nr:O-antigen polymerase [Flammeovirga pectinis]AZQ63438.1 oligosaccharide repeat unit polymerase [Flammeovirga pectinis]